MDTETTNLNSLAQHVLTRTEQEKVSFIKLQFTDVVGMIKAVTIPADKLEDAINNNVWFDGSSIQGFTRIFESDMYLKLDLNTFAVLPWTKDGDHITARIICDVYTTDGKPFKGDPRYILKNQLSKLAEMGYEFNVGPELEFFLFRKENGKIDSLPHDRAGYFDLTSDLAGEVRKEITLNLKELGVDVEALHHEVAEGQHEIGFKYGPALEIADQAITFKFTVKAVAQKYGLHATFMPKPLGGQNGSGMHVHQSMFKDGENAFFDDSAENKLSETALNFIGGQLKHIKAVSAITNPLVNSYKRLVAGFEAPVYISWGETNRSALIRIPRYTPGKGKSVRCELRSPDPSCNPYLAFAVMLAAGMDGMKEKTTPPPAVNENIYEFNEAKAQEMEIDNLPHTMKEAMMHLGENEVIKEALGSHAYQSIKVAKKAEWDAYRTHVSSWERENYLENY